MKLQPAVVPRECTVAFQNEQQKPSFPRMVRYPYSTIVGTKTKRDSSLDTT